MDSEEWDADDPRYNNWTEFSAEATAFVKSGAVDEIDASPVLRMIEKGNANEKRRSRCTASIRTILMDCAGSPFKAVEETPFCHYCGENLPRDASNAEEVCDDCSSIGCECCGKTSGEMIVEEAGLGPRGELCYDCIDNLCEECAMECPMCENIICRECMKFEYHSLEKCEERTTGNVCATCQQDTFWRRPRFAAKDVPWCKNCNHEIDGGGRCVVTLHNKTLGAEDTPRVVCELCEKRFTS